MPYIRGRYYMNPVVGDALEAAREAEAALQALEHAAKVARGDTGEEDDAGAGSSNGNGSYANGSSASGGSGVNSNADAYAKSAPGPIHRVEIEAAELVPAHSGRAQRGFVARIHRRANGNAANAPVPGDAGVRTAGAPTALAFGFVLAIRRRLRERIRLAIRAQLFGATKRHATRPRNPRLLQSQRPNQFPPRPIRRRLQVAQAFLPVPTQQQAWIAIA